MLYSEIKREVLGHIDQYSMAGTPVAASYNNQADYLSRIPVLINEGLVNIRTLVKPDPVVLPLENGEVGRAGRRGACGLAVSAGTMPPPDLRPSSDRGVPGERPPRCYELLLLAAAA